MKSVLKFLGLLMLGFGFAAANSPAQTDGTARLNATILDYNGSGTEHWTVAWVTTGAGTFIKSLRKQGPTISASHWNNHCTTWYAAKAGSTALDGYSSATADDYAGTNSPVVLTWNCRDANNNLVADGNYRFWIQYSEDDENAEGPVTTSGLLWTKGPGAATNTYANQPGSFTNLKVTWSPAALPVKPTITSPAPTAMGTVGVPYVFVCAATGTAPIRFLASNLPAGLTITTNGLISGNPTATGSFAGTITATNGTLPNATQGFSIVIGLVPANIATARLIGNQLVMSGNGPTNGIYTMLGSTNVSALMGQWSPIATNSFDNTGQFRFTNAVGSSAAHRFYRLRVP